MPEVFAHLLALCNEDTPDALLEQAVTLVEKHKNICFPDYMTNLIQQAPSHPKLMSILLEILQERQNELELIPTPDDKKISVYIVVAVCFSTRSQIVSVLSITKITL